MKTLQIALYILFLIFNKKKLIKSKYMKLYKAVTLITLVFIINSCGNKTNENDSLFSLKINNSKKIYILDDTINLSIENKKNRAIDSVSYSINDLYVGSSKKNTTSEVKLNNQKLGQRIIAAKIYSEGAVFETNHKIKIVAAKKPILYTYTILETYPHDINAFTQGLEFKGDTLIESTGQYKTSTLRKTNYKTGEIYKKVDIGNQYFGEGLTFLNDKIYQLTWREKTGFIYDANTLEKKGTFVYGKSKEGWGLCNNGEKIYKSDGTQRIWQLNSNTLAEEDYIEIYTNTSKIDSVNELEWVEGKIYANIYQKDAIAIVNPNTGAVEGVINLKGLKDKVTQHKSIDVLNGIAYKGEKNILYITGKKWDKLFKIEISIK
ncbi:MAG: glutamine cyclotransferase [Flavobacteriaceae bacterium]|jgi:glutamine cyclotransferase